VAATAPRHPHQCASARDRQPRLDQNLDENPRPFTWNKTADDIARTTASYLHRIRPRRWPTPSAPATPGLAVRHCSSCSRFRRRERGDDAVAGVLEQETTAVFDRRAQHVVLGGEAFRMPSASAFDRRVEPFTSVNRNVTTPEEAAAAAAPYPGQPRDPSSAPRRRTALSPACSPLHHPKPQWGNAVVAELGVLAHAVPHEAPNAARHRSSANRAAATAPTAQPQGLSNESNRDRFGVLLTLRCAR
jgi:hypothetical protein